MPAFRAKYVFPVAGPPLPDGIVAFEDDRITVVGEQNSPAVKDLAQAAQDLGDVAILPGLVNPHTHLEFSDLRQPLGTRGMAFPDWIRLVLQHRRTRPDFTSLIEDPDSLPLERAFAERIAHGFDESTRFGVTAVGEIASKSSGFQFSPRLEITQFHEQIGLRSGARPVAPKELLTAESSGRCRFAISPHAPYSVHPELLQFCASFSGYRKIPLAHHLAETKEELELLASGQGPMRKLLEDLDAWDPDAIPAGSRPLDYLQMLSEAHRVLIIHGNYLDDEEIGFIASNRDRMSVIYCPRTHDYFQHDPYPLSKMLAAGINVALGTDSRASSPDLSPLAELRFAAKKHPLVSTPMLLAMITKSAARALGRDHEIGTIEQGKFADFAVVKLPSHDAADPHELLLGGGEVIATIFRGQMVHGEEAISARS